MRPVRLSPREEAVLACAAEGLVDKEIATRLGISVHTLHTYWKRIRAKLGYQSRAALVYHGTQGKRRHGVSADWNPFSRWVVDFEQGTVNRYDMAVANGDGDSSTTHSTPGRVVHPDDFQRIGERWHAMIQGQRDAETLKYRAASGQQSFMVYSLGSILRNPDGKPTKIFGYSIAAPENEDLDSPLAGGWWIANRNRRLFCADEGCCRIFGIDPGSRQNAGAFLSCLQPESRQWIWSEYRRVRRRGSGFMSGEVEMMRPEAASERVLVRAWFEVWPDGQVLVLGEAVTWAGNQGRQQ